MLESPQQVEVTFITPEECGRACQDAIAKRYCPVFSEYTYCPIFEKELLFYKDFIDGKIARIREIIAEMDEVD